MLFYPSGRLVCAHHKIFAAKLLRKFLKYAGKLYAYDKECSYDGAFKVLKSLISETYSS